MVGDPWIDVVECVLWRGEPTPDRLRAVSGYAETLLGFGVGDWLEPGFLERQTHPADQARVKEALAAAVAANARFDLELRLRRRDEEFIAVRWTGRPESGGWVGYLLRTPSAPAEDQARRETEARFRALVELSPDVIALHQDGRLVFLNDAGRRLVGVDPDEDIGGVPLLDFVHKDDRAMVRDRIQTMLSTGHRVGFVEERFIHRKTGAIIDAEVAALPLTVGGRPAVQLVARDMTERKRLEERLRQMHNLESVGRLAGGIAHDFNNLLTAILGHLDLVLAETPSRSRHLDSLNDARRAAERARDLTKQLLMFAKRRNGKRQPLLVDGFVRETLAVLRPLIPKNVSVELDLDDGHLAIMADPAQMHQVLMNLTLNACDAMVETGGTLSLSTRVKTEGGLSMVISVGDTGHGMSSAVRARIFEPFFTTKGPGKGTGLGLATAYGIVSQHGGSVQVESEVGQGTRFDLLFPAVPPDAVRPAKVPSVLVVEDEPLVRRLIHRALSAEGYRVVEAGDGVEALAMLEHSGPVDLVISDVVMPRMSGPELKAALLERQAKLPFLLMSGNGTEQDGSQSEGFIQKPFRPQDLVERARRLLEATESGSR